MTFKPSATVFQHGDRLVVASTSFAAGRRANGWFEDLTTGSSDAELTAALEAALDRSRPEDFKDLPQPSSPESTLASDRLGFVSDSAMTRATTTVSVILTEDGLVVRTFKTVDGQGYVAADKLAPVSDHEQYAKAVRLALAESARLSTVDHAAIAGGRSPAPIDEDPGVRVKVADIPNLAQAVVTRYGGRWAVESMSRSSEPNGWIQTSSSGDDSALASVVVDALVKSGEEGRAPLPRSQFVVEAFGVSSPADLLGTDCVRIALLVSTTTGEIGLHAQVVGDEGWWVTPAHPETRTVRLAEELPLWGRTLSHMADDLVAAH